MARLDPDRPANRRRALRRLTGRAATLAAVVGLTMLGNLRLQASEVPVVSAKRLSVSWVATGARAAPVNRAIPHPAAITGPDGAAEDADDLRLVPAIYAWNPDVRFVYYRHVRKWM